MAAICAVRLKPPVDAFCPIKVSETDRWVTFKPPKTHRLARLPPIAPIHFDHCFNHTATQHDLFRDLSPHYIEHVLNGHNACVMAYGITGSGKSYTIMGNEEEPGLALLSSEEIFSRVGEGTTIAVSFVEIYNETVLDLLDSQKRKRRVREHPVFGPYVSDLSSVPVSDYFTLIQIFYTALSRRTVASTPMNPQSSRSHVIFSLTLTHPPTPSVPTTSSTLHFIDLAGCERSSSLNPSSPSSFKEGTVINQSLSSLSLVLSALLQKAKHSFASQSHASVFVPYRDSILTWLLKETLEPTVHVGDMVRFGEEGKKSVIVMVATVKGDEEVLDESVASVRYVARVKGIEKVLRKQWRSDHGENEKQSKKVEKDELVMREDKEDVEKLRRHLESSKALVRDMESLWRQKLTLMEEKYLEEKRRRENVEEKLAFLQKQSAKHAESVEFHPKETEPNDSEEEVFESTVTQNEEEKFWNQAPEPSIDHNGDFDSFLVPPNNSMHIPLRKGENYIGSDPNKASILLEGCFIDGLHATISVHEETWITPNYLDFVGELSKVYVNGFLITGPTLLKSGVRILFGRSHMFQFIQKSVDEAVPTSSSSIPLEKNMEQSSMIPRTVCPIIVSIPHIDRIRSRPRPYDLFHILITLRTPSSMVSWTVARRYSELYDFFHTDLFPVAIRSQFPPKSLRAPFSSEMLGRRHQALEKFLDSVLQWFWERRQPEFTWSQAAKPVSEHDVWSLFPILSPKGYVDSYTGKWIQLK